MSFISTSQTVVKSRRLSWQEWLGWLGIALALAQMLSAWTVVDLSSSRAYYVRLFYATGEILAALIFWATAHKEQRLGAKVCWYMRSVALIIVAALAVDKILVGLHHLYGGYIVAHGQELYLIAYVTALLAMMIYFPKRAWFLGSTYRLIIDGATIGFAALVIMQTVLPLVFPWPLSAAVVEQMRYIAYEIVALFVFTVLYMRFGLRGGGPLCFAAVAAIVCLIAADALYLWMIYYPGLSPNLGFSIQPLYIFHGIVLAMGAHWSLTKPPHLPSALPSETPFRERLAWKLPHFAMIVAISSIALAGKPEILPPVLLLWGIDGIVVTIEQQQVSHQLRQAVAQLRQRRIDTTLSVIKSELQPPKHNADESGEDES